MCLRFVMPWKRGIEYAGADWEGEIAKRLRKETTAKKVWIAKRLAMGYPNYVSNPVNG